MHREMDAASPGTPRQTQEKHRAAHSLAGVRPLAPEYPKGRAWLQGPMFHVKRVINVGQSAANTAAGFDVYRGNPGRVRNLPD